MNNLVDLWVTRPDGVRFKTQYSEEAAIKIAAAVLKKVPKSNPMIGYLY